MLKKRILSVVLCLCLVSITCLVPAYAFTYGDWSNGWALWSQGQSRYSGMRGWGCLVVAKAKMLVAAGIASSDPNVFNPDLFYEWELSRDYIKSDMNATTYEDPVWYANGLNKSFKYEGATYGNNESKVWENIRAGKYTIL